MSRRSLGEIDAAAQVSGFDVSLDAFVPIRDRANTDRKIDAATAASIKHYLEVNRTSNPEELYLALEEAGLLTLERKCINGRITISFKLNLKDDT